MLKKYLIILISVIIYANPTPTPLKVMPLDEPFTLSSTKSTFNTDILYTYKELLKCNPKLDAVYKIEGIHKVKIIPKSRLKAGELYQCKYGKDIIKFKTQPFKLVNSHYFKREKLLRVTFNSDIDSKDAKKYIEVKKINKLTTTNLTYTITQKSHNSLLLKINEPTYNNPIELTIKKGLKSVNGKSLDEDFSKLFNTKTTLNITLDDKKDAMRIIDKPQMVALDSGEFAIRVFSDDTFDNNLKDFIEIEGIENFTVNTNNFVGYKQRKRLNLSDRAYYFHDIITPEFKPNHTYKLTIKKGLRSYKELKEDKKYTVKSGDLGKSIIFDNKKPYISKNGELGFSSINIDTATIIVQKVLDDNLRYFINFKYADRFVVDRYLKEVFSKEIKLKNIKNKKVKQKFLFSDLGEELPYGVYKITIRYTDRGEEKKKSRVLFLSNIGISAYISKTQAFIHTMNLDSSTPLISAMVYLYGENNELLGSAKSDKYGMVNIEDDKLLSKKPISVIVETKTDRNFLVLEKSISLPSITTLARTSERFSANIYFQSNIVRPSSKINALITIKDREFISAKQLPIKVILKRRYGKSLIEKIYHTDNYGLIDFNYQLDSEDRTGLYDIEVYIDKTLIGSKSIKVEAFMPPKIENQIKMVKDNYLKGQLIEANISSNYLFGTPASYLNGKIKIVSVAKDLKLSSYKDYSFTNYAIKDKRVDEYFNYNEDIRLNSRGKLNIAIPISIKRAVPSILEATLGVTIMDDNQPVSKYKKLKIFPYKNMVGLKLDNRELRKGQELKGKTVLIDPIMGKEIDRELYVTIKKIDWHYNYSNGNSHWEEEKIVVDSFTIKANQPFVRKVNQNGDYTIEVHDRLGGHSASSNFTIWWHDYSNISPKDDLKSVEIKFEDKPYKKGDTIGVNIKSPILNGQLLITIEDSKVRGYRLVNIEKGVATVDIPITFDIKKGAYLHATVYRATDTSSKLIPFRAIGYRYIKPDNSNHKIDVKIEAPKVTKSKRKIKLNIVTNKSSKILVSVVDKGILQLTDQDIPKIFEFFNKQSDKQIAYYDIYDNLMAYLTEGKQIDFGAGDILSARKKHLAPDLAKRVKPFMVWSGVIDTKGNSTTIGIDIPEFNGKASIVAIAVNEDSVGVASKDIVVKDDIMIKPSYPLYALKGDSLIVPIRVFNTTSTVKDVLLSSTFSKNIELNLEENNLTIAPNSSTVVNAKLDVKEKGRGKIKLIAKFGQDEVSREVELPIYSPYAISTKTFKGISNKQESLIIPKEYMGAKVYITLSDNLIGILGNDLKYLIGYPYGCTEQITSKILAMYYARAFLKDTVLVGESENFIRQGIKRLRNMQNYYGEFAYWEKDGEINPYASLYASQTILELNKGGDVYIDQTVIEKIIKALRAIVTKNDDYLGKYTSFHRVYAGYILAENGLLRESSANMLFEKGFYKEFFLSKYYMSAILKIQGKNREAEELYNSVGYKLTSYLKSRYSNYSGNFESNIRDMLIQFIIKSRYFKKDVKDLATIEHSFDSLYSTQERAMALKAVSIYLGKPTNSKLDVTLNINNSEQNHTKPISLVIDKLTSNKIVITPNSNAMSYTIELVKHLPKKLKNSLSKGKKLSIKREFIDENSHKVNLNSLKQGDKIYSKVTISNYGKVQNVVVNQRVPACLTILNSRIQNETPNEKFKNININQKYRDIRDDRVLDFIDLPKKQKYNRSSKRYIIKENRGVIFTPLLVTTKGECQIPAVIAESMYDSRINDYAKGVDKIIVKRDIKKSLDKKVSFEDRANSLVKKLYYREMQSNNPADFVELFSYPITQYYHKQNATKQDVIKDKANYFKEWKERDYKNINLKTIHLNKKLKEITIQITFNYVIKNGKKELKGVSRHLVTIKEIGKKLLITKIKVSK